MRNTRFDPWLIVARIAAIILALGGLGAALAADGPADNRQDSVRPVPPPGIAVPSDVRAELQAAAERLGRGIESVREALRDRPSLQALLPDVQVFHYAVRSALEHGEFYRPAEFESARTLLRLGEDRLRDLAAGRAPWTTATGLVVRGYLSRIDGSVQPYGLVVPPSYDPAGSARHRLDCWFHGRGENLTELNFLTDRLRNPGEFTPPHAFVLHPYGRYCNANKLAGEVDLFEALEHVKRGYRIDPDRIAVRGFSMGGAACWQFAVHFPGEWAAAAPGAGFAETPEFLRVFQSEEVRPTWWERKLWHQYDCTDYAANLAGLPTVAYSGENDRQKQAADVMARALAAEGISLVHVIGPKTGHSYHPDAKREIDRRLDAILEVGRTPVPDRVRFTTWTLRYPRAFWVTVDGMGEHWERARVEARVERPRTLRITTQNVTGLTLEMPPGRCPLEPGVPVRIHVDGQRVDASAPASDRSWSARLRREGGRWRPARESDEAGLRKRPGLQGPIDDAFMDSFLMVRPTGEPAHPAVGRWVQSEMAHAIDHWRRQFRGEARVKADSEVTDADIADSNLVLWGDYRSNRLLARILGHLPLRWDGESLGVDGAGFPSGTHVPVLIYPNPLNPRRYIVLNSGFTFREYDYLNNARQVPRLPDWAIVDTTTPPSPRWPGRVARAGFFGERWEVKPAREDP